MKTFTLTALCLCVCSQSVDATLLSGNLNADNRFQLYISENDNTAGDFLLNGIYWDNTYSFNNFELEKGVNYYLHVLATDVGGRAGFIGDFQLTGNDHLFAGYTDYIVTNNVDWSVSTTGWSDYVQASDFGENGALPWGTIDGVDSDANWIWSENNVDDNLAYFSVAIENVGSSGTPVSIPGTMALLSTGLLLALRQRKKNSQTTEEI